MKELRILFWSIRITCALIIVCSYYVAFSSGFPLLCIIPTLMAIGLLFEWHWNKV